jgi:hypothetical protein
VSDVNKSDVTLALSERFHNSVDSVARQSKNDRYVPSDETVDENIRRCL